MKSIFTFFLLFFSILLNAQQPQWLNPKPFGGEMEDIEFFDTLSGLMVGRSGSIAITSDGAQTWQLINSGTTSNLWDIEIYGPLMAIVRSDTFLLRTDDGGLTFSPTASLDSGWKYSSVSMVNQSLGYASSQRGYWAEEVRFGRSTDGGQTWQWDLFNDSSDIRITQITFIDSLSGVGVQNFQSYPQIFRTIDGGQSWDAVLGLTEDCHSILAKDPQKGTLYLLGSYYDAQSYYGNIIQSSDSGATWSAVFFKEGVRPWCGLKTINDSIIIAAGTYFYSYKGEEESKSLSKNIFISSDAGQNWSMASKPTGTSINGCSAVGLRTKTDAYVWTGSNNLSNMQLFTTHDLSNFSPETGTFQAFVQDMEIKENVWYLLSGESDGNIQCAVLKSVDYGITWDTLPLELPSYQEARFLSFADEYTGLLAGNDLNNYVYRTLDGGATWQNTFLGDYGYPLALYTFGYGSSYLLTWNTLPVNKCKLLFSNNMGGTWSELNIPEDTLNYMQFISPDTGFLFGGGKTTANGGYYITHNSGQDWAFLDLGIPCLSRGVFMSSTEGYVSVTSNRAKLYYVKDGVAQMVFSADSTHIIADFSFSDADHGYLITAYKLSGWSEWLSDILYTDNGGQTWQKYGPYTKLNGVKTFYDANGFAYGNYGVLLQLGNGYPVGQAVIPSTNSEAKAWPNPATSQLQITIPLFARDGAELSITNVAGEVVFQQKVFGESAAINIQDMPAGLYFYTLTNATNKVSGRVVVQ